MKPIHTIRLQQVCPRIFQGNDMSHSDVWCRDMSFEKGKHYLIEAMSGTGKSSLCSYLLGFRNDFSGHILFDETDTANLKTADWTNLRCHHISHLFQELRLFPELTAMENVEVKNRLTRHTDRKKIEEWFERLGIAEKKDTLIGKMSFGQQQRVALMRALSQPFDFLLADEPVSHLDDHNAAVMGNIMREEAERQGASLILTSIGKHIDMPYDQVLTL